MLKRLFFKKTVTDEIEERKNEIFKMLHELKVVSYQTNIDISPLEIHYQKEILKLNQLLRNN